MTSSLKYKIYKIYKKNFFEKKQKKLTKKTTKKQQNRSKNVTFLLTFLPQILIPYDFQSKKVNFFIKKKQKNFEFLSKFTCFRDRLSKKITKIKKKSVIFHFFTNKIRPKIEVKLTFKSFV